MTLAKPAPVELDTDLCQHQYLSTACRHRLCDQCRHSCTFCAAPCECTCHGWELTL